MGLFLYFSKAFDTVNHQILLNKLDKYGIMGVANTWINSYLTNRKQFVFFNDNVSAAKTVLCRVLQGSILGKLLFLLYVNDVVNVSDNMFPILFADDTNVFINAVNLNNMTVSMNKDLLNITTLISLYYAFIYSYLMYGVEVWDGALSSYKDVLIKIVRVMVSASFHAHTPRIFKKLNIMTFDNIYNYFVCIFMFKVTKHIHPQTFDSMLVQN